MFDLRPIGVIVGGVLTILAIAMLGPFLIDLTHPNPDGQVFLASSGMTLVLGLLLIFANRQGRRPHLSTRQLFLATSAAWIAAWIVAALPLARASLHLSLTDALFEAASGVTATGGTILRGLDSIPPGILMWRATLQWLGGIGILITGIIVLPTLDVGGMGIFRLDSMGAGDRVMPRAAKIMGKLILVYTGITVILALLLWLAGMSRFPALIHAMSTISCGGFSSADGSIGAWATPGVQWVVLLGMLLGGAPFVIHLQLIQGKWRQIAANRQLAWYATIFAAASVALWAWLWFHDQVKPLPALRHGAFAVASMMTGTGYSTLDYGSWQGFPLVVLFLLTFLGGCAGSTAGGLKIFRLRILASHTRAQMIRLLRPHAVIRAAPEPLAHAVIGFLFLYALAFAFVAMGLAMTGFDFMSAISAAASALANMGPGLTRAVGPLAGYGGRPDSAKLLLMAAMLFGRVEMFAMVALFMPSFWRQ